MYNITKVLSEPIITHLSFLHIPTDVITFQSIPTALNIGWLSNDGQVYHSTS